MNEGGHTDGYRLRKDHMEDRLGPRHSQRQCALHLDRFYGLQAAPEGLRHIGAAQKGQSQYPARLRRYVQSDLGQAKIEKEQLHKQRCVPEKLNINTGNILQNRYLIMPDQRA